MDWGGANSRFLGLVSVWAARSFDQTAFSRGFIKFVSRWWKVKVGGGALRPGMGY